jgi:TRAP-type C4-dicarboxylate transport system permease small subunit
MLNIIRDSIAVIFGLLMIIFCKTFAKKTSNFYYTLLHRRFSEKGYQAAFIIGGMAFILIGLLSLFGILKYKQ